MQSLRPVQGGQVAAFEDVQGLTDRRAAGRRRCHAGNGQPAVVDQRGCPEQGAVAVQVGLAHQAGPDETRGARDDRRLLHRRDDVLAKPSLVEIVRSARAQQGVGARQVPVAQHRAHLGWGTARKEQLPSAGERGKAFGVGRSLLAEGLVDDESPIGEPSRRAQGLPEVDRPPTIQRQRPGGWRPWNADGQPTGDCLGEGNRLAVLDEGVRSHSRRRGFPPIDRADPAGAGVVVHEEPTTADSGAVGLGDAQGSRSGDGGIDRVATALQAPSGRSRSRTGQQMTLRHRGQPQSDPSAEPWARRRRVVRPV